MFLLGITHGPPPKWFTDSNDETAFENKRKEWKKGYEEWKNITCPCGMGYFDENGRWVSGEDVRRAKLHDYAQSSEQFLGFKSWLD